MRVQIDQITQKQKKKITEADKNVAIIYVSLLPADVNTQTNNLYFRTCRPMFAMPINLNFVSKRLEQVRTAIAVSIIALKGA